MGDDSAANTNFRWDYAANASTGSQYDCSQTSLPSDIRYAPAEWRGQKYETRFLDLARGLERACFDYLIIEDSSMVR